MVNIQKIKELNKVLEDSYLLCNPYKAYDQSRIHYNGYKDFYLYIYES